MSQEIDSAREPTLFAVFLVRLMVAAILLAALLNGQTQLALFSLLVLLIVAGASVWSRFAAKAVTIKSSLSKTRVFAGETVLLRIEIKNAKFLPARIRIPISISEKGIEALDQTVFECGILWHETVCLETSLKAAKRGLYRIGAGEGSISDLLGFFPRGIKAHSLADLTVYPRVHPICAIDIPRTELFGTPGSRSPVQDPVYLLGTRQYEPRVPARFIHWKASARRQILQEKLFQPSEQEKVLIVLETEGFKGAEGEEDFELAVELAASLAVHLGKMGSAVGFATDGGVRGTPWVKIGRAPGLLTELLDRLASISTVKRNDLLQSIRNSLNTAWGATCLHLAGAEAIEGSGINALAAMRRIPLLRIYCSVRGCPQQSCYRPLSKEMAIGEILPFLKHREGTAK
jgi:uncharacterized protein (DUF58 family)